MFTAKQKSEMYRKAVESIPEKQWDYLYVIRCEQYYKIGYTFDLKTRLDNLQTANPFALYVVLAVRHPEARVIERMLHQFFYDKKVVGEWFLLDEKDLKKIKTDFLD